MPDERSPLLGGLHIPTILGGNKPASRYQYLDNLRAVLVILLIFQHAVMETTQGAASHVGLHSWDGLPLALFVQVNKYFLWPTFFFVAGYSSYLGFEKRNADYKFMIARLLKLGLPALLWTKGGIRFAVISLLQYYGLKDVFPTPWAGGLQARLAGPVPFICGLLVLDGVYFIWRLIGNVFRVIEQSRVVGRVAASKFALYSTIAVSAAIHVGCTIISIFFVHRMYPEVFYNSFQYDIGEAPSHPVGFIIAYFAGINFRYIKKAISIDHPLSALFGTQFAAYASLGIAQHFSSLLWENIKLRDFSDTSRRDEFIGRGFNFHTLFYVAWSTFVIFALPVTLVIAFSKLSFTRKDWGEWTRNTYVQTYIHMIPVLIGVHYIGTGGGFGQFFGEGIMKSVLVGCTAIANSWIVGHAIPVAFQWLQTVAR
ncbi:hypothetical protein D9613_002374 [Agrocybe pediades]|uniref:Acyltransferase 3 domain-containing protein n=1 Tax=Agrocybe pediades TaxID=84607 RepID=A0A8H4R605_9AGAR|nr:hypothetical protein D9613_002374 [Agrocybe pediades]